MSHIFSTEKTTDGARGRVVCTCGLSTVWMEPGDAPASLDEILEWVKASWDHEPPKGTPPWLARRHTDRPGAPPDAP
jgi:hypothetical protein